MKADNFTIKRIDDGEFDVHCHNCHLSFLHVVKYRGYVINCPFCKNRFVLSADSEVKDASE